jgi:hypothetical protein
MFGVDSEIWSYSIFADYISPCGEREREDDMLLAALHYDDSALIRPDGTNTSSEDDPRARRIAVPGLNESRCLNYATHVIHEDVEFYYCGELLQL